MERRARNVRAVLRVCSVKSECAFPLVASEEGPLELGEAVVAAALVAEREAAPMP